MAYPRWNIFPPMLAAALVLAAPVAHARVSHYKTMAVHLAQEGDAFLSKQELSRALDSYYRVYRYDANYEPAAYAAGRIVEIMASHAGRKGACLKEIDKPSLALIVRYIAGTDSMRKGYYAAPSDWDPLAASRAAYKRVFGKAFDEKPLSAGIGERRGDDKKLPALKEVLEKIVQSCHANLPSGPAGHFARELATVRAEWNEPAMAAVKTLLMARSSLGDHERMELILGACSDWQDAWLEGRQEQKPCRKLLDAWPEVGRGLAESLRPHLASVDPGIQRTVAVLLGREGKLQGNDLLVVRERLFNAADEKEWREFSELAPSLAGQGAKPHAAAFAEKSAAIAAQAAKARNDFEDRRRLRNLASVLFSMGPDGADLVRATAAKSDDRYLQGAALAGITCSRSTTEQPFLAKQIDSVLGWASKRPDDAVIVLEDVALAVQHCGGLAMLPVLLPIAKAGPPHAAFEVVRATLALLRAHGDASSADQAMAMKLAAAIFARQDLGKDTMYIQQDALMSLDRIRQPAVVALICSLRTPDEYLVARQLEVLGNHASLDAAAASAFAKTFVEHPSERVRKAAATVLRRAQ